ncbi:MAG TPA: Fur family transcriptional regulator [Anaerolineales bacterium]|nr:Fur family transcriptional regulator [Anaerolineales bacterium]
MSCTSEYAIELRSRGFRMTSQRLTILHVLRHAGTHLSPGEIYKQARNEVPGITEPTVYRTLEWLVKNGLVRPSHSGSGHFTYQIAGDDHHHILCRMCGSEVEVEHTQLENLYRSLEESSGYRKINSHLTFIGVCPNCASILVKGT